MSLLLDGRLRPAVPQVLQAKGIAMSQSNSAGRFRNRRTRMLVLTFRLQLGNLRRHIGIRTCRSSALHALQRDLLPHLAQL